jgi:biotin synthase
MNEKDFKGMAGVERMRFDERGRIVDFGVEEATLKESIESGTPFMTSGCRSKNREGACNRPYSNSTPYQALIGEIRNYPFQPTPDDIKIIKMQLWDYSDVPVKRWIEAPELVDEVQ